MIIHDLSLFRGQKPVPELLPFFDAQRHSWLPPPSPASVTSVSPASVWPGATVRVPPKNVLADQLMNNPPR